MKVCFKLSFIAVLIFLFFLIYLNALFNLLEAESLVQSKYNPGQLNYAGGLSLQLNEISTLMNEHNSILESVESITAGERKELKEFIRINDELIRLAIYYPDLFKRVGTGEGNPYQESLLDSNTGYASTIIIDWTTEGKIILNKKLYAYFGDSFDLDFMLRLKNLERSLVSVLESEYQITKEYNKNDTLFLGTIDSFIREYYYRTYFLFHVKYILLEIYNGSIELKNQEHLLTVLNTLMEVYFRELSLLLETKKHLSYLLLDYERVYLTKELPDMNISNYELKELLKKHLDNYAILISNPRSLLFELLNEIWDNKYYIASYAISLYYAYMVDRLESPATTPYFRYVTLDILEILLEIILAEDTDDFLDYIQIFLLTYFEL